jgi:hypothetical protein
MLAMDPRHEAAMTMTRPLGAITGLLIGLGLLGAGWLVGQGMARLRTDDRYVVVKGASERDVDADLVVWPLAHSVNGNDLAEVQRQLDANTAIIRDFFTSAGFPATDLVVSPPRLQDRWQWASANNRPSERYQASVTVTLRTRRVADAIAALRRSGELLTRGVVLDTNEGSGPQFEYTQLNQIKPGLIAEATASARKSAAQFAKDSQSRLGGIRSASQGQISITDRDQGSPQVKTVRVVTTVEYFLRE